MKKDGVMKFNDTLGEKGYTIFCGESVTAGMITGTIASAPGASCVLKGGIVAYTEEIKIKLLRVKPATIRKHTAESMETTKEMVKGLAAMNTGADICLAITGVASKPVSHDHEVKRQVGQMYVAILFHGKMNCFETLIRTKQGDPMRRAATAYALKKVIAVISGRPAAGL